MSSKKWVNNSFLVVIFILGILTFFNYLSDPFWLFDNFHTKYKNEYNERMQKTNLIVNNNIDFDGILLGSSRSSVLNIKKYKDYKIFNYSVSSLTPKEYIGYINIAKKVKGSELKVIILGLDFFSYLNEEKILIPSEEYYNDANSLGYSLKSLISYDTFKKAKKNINTKLNPGERYYLSDYSIYTPFRDPKDVLKKVTASAAFYSEEKYKESSNPVLDYNETFFNIVKENPKSKIIVYTTPVSKKLLEVIIQNGIYDLYESWIRDLVEIFGEVCHFMYLNNITENYTKNYYDGHHFYTHIGDLMIKKLQNGNSKIDFGIKIDGINIDKVLKKLRIKHMRELK